MVISHHVTSRALPEVLQLLSPSPFRAFPTDDDDDDGQLPPEHPDFNPQQ
jgi:hypothetical protein